jgi:hypothetical protein
VMHDRATSPTLRRSSSREARPGAVRRGAHGDFTRPF